LVLVTGANGYIASHIIDTLLQEGYSVRGTVRSEKPWLDALFEAKYGSGKFQSMVIPDLTVKEDLEKALDGVTGVIHSVGFYQSQGRSSRFCRGSCKWDILLRTSLTVSQASDLTLALDRELVINGTTAHTLAILKAAATQPSVKSFVLTSSSSSALVPVPNKEGVVVDECTCNSRTLKIHHILT